MNRTYNLIFLLFFSILVMFSFSVSADRLVNQVPENQLFSTSTTIYATGMIDESSSIDWTVSSGSNLTGGRLTGGENIGITSYDNSLLTNGGEISDKNAIVFDSQDKKKGLYNLETGRVLTYNSLTGSHLSGLESYRLNIAGDSLVSTSEVVCVFTPSSYDRIPAFCNVVHAESRLINVNSAQVSQSGSARMTGSVYTPAVLNYQLAVSPDLTSGSDFASGTISTLFEGTVLEGRDNSTNLSGENPSGTHTWKDNSEVTGGIKMIKKTFVYGSGLYL